jgi:hypothetical protein
MQGEAARRDEPAFRTETVMRFMDEYRGQIELTVAVVGCLLFWTTFGAAVYVVLR